MLRSGLYPMLPTQSLSLRLRVWYTRFGTKPAGTSDMLARSSLRCATLAPSSTSTLCLRNLASLTKTFIDLEVSQIAKDRSLNPLRLSDTRGNAYCRLAQQLLSLTDLCFASDEVDLPRCRRPRGGGMRGWGRLEVSRPARCNTEDNTDAATQTVEFYDQQSNQ